MSRNAKTLCHVAVVLAATALLATAAGCRVRVDKNAEGEDKKVQIDTPFGGVHVDTNQTTAADLGLPVYPGAQLVEHQSSKSADVHLGFGHWELRVKAANYSVTDSSDKVVAFYRKALGRYGDVIACQGNTPVGAPAKTSEGLTCAEGSKARVQVGDNGDSYGDDGKDGFELKAGSHSHQHVVGFLSSAPGQTRFSLVSLDLPEGTGSDSAKSD
jgi:hypothetical protein